MNEQYKAAIEKSTRRAQVVYFSTPTCGPCRVMKPGMRDLKALYGFDLVELDATEFAADELKELGIRAVPHIKVIIRGQVTDDIVGQRSSSEMKRVLTLANVITDGLDFE
jgi:thioredoxin-like negative regulator of GroEL